MRSTLRCAVAVIAMAGGLLTGPTAADADPGVVAVTGSGTMSAVTPAVSTGGVSVSGAINGTLIGGPGIGICSFTGSFSGIESYISGSGSGSFGCGTVGTCGFDYHRVGLQLALQASCSAGWFQAGGLAEPNSVLPTTGYLFQALGAFGSSIDGVVMQGNFAFSPGTVVGVTVGTVLPVPTPIAFSGSMSGVLGGALTTCTLSMSGTGVESQLTGNAALSGVCNGPFFSMSCSLQWTHLATQAFISGFCSWPGGQVIGTGELVVAGPSFTLVGEFTFV